MRLAIVVLTCGRPALAMQCLRSLSTEVTPGLDSVVLVVNGGGVDDAAQMRGTIEQEGWSAWVSLLARATNGGFSVGTNTGLRHVLAVADPPQYCMLLNDDTVVRPGALAVLHQTLAGQNDIDIGGCGMEEPDGRPQTSAFRFPSIATELDGALRLGWVSRLLADRVLAAPYSAVAQRVDWVPGAAMVVRREVWQRIGLLDERFFLYFDDIDLCQRARRAGFHCWVLPQVRVAHLRGQTTCVRAETATLRRRPEYWYRSRRHYFEKHHGWWYATLVDIAVIFGSLLRRASSPLRRRRHADPPYFVRDTLRHGLLARRALPSSNDER